MAAAWRACFNVDTLSDTKECPMSPFSRHSSMRPLRLAAVVVMGLAAVAAGTYQIAATAAREHARPGAPGTPYAGMPAIAPIGVRVDQYAAVPEAARGPAIDPAKGYRTEPIGDGLYMISDGSYQSMFMTYEDGVVVVDAPPSYAAHIPKAIAEVTTKPITHLVYSHHHADHIGGAGSLGGRPIVIAHAETNRLLARAGDPNRPLATVTFDRDHRLTVGSQTLELSYGGAAHSPGNIYIFAPKQRALMIVDVIFPGWMPWRRFALAQDVPAYFAQVREIATWDFDTLIGGHVARTGTRKDVATQLAFLDDLKAAAGTALKTTTPGEELDAADRGNPWALFDNYIDRVVVQCVNTMTPKWSSQLAAFDVYIWDQCYSMEQSLRLD
jgi:glyoxylase-like metal-dependent hydrolase (beta-lactamase superfamily II)